MKKLMLMLVAVIAVISAKADLLYFMADAFDWGGPKYFDFAMIGVAKDGITTWGEGGSQVYLDIASTPGSVSDSSIFASADSSRSTAIGWADLNGYTGDGYTFYVETYSNDSEAPIWGYGEATAKSYAQLVQAGHVYIPGTTEVQDISAWVVPEPTSGMLILLGIAGLALRRRKFEVKG